MNTLKLSIATPNGEIFNSDNIYMVNMETHAGALGVMAKHEPLVTTIKVGVLKVITDKKEEIYFATSEGFAECHGTEINIMVQTAENGNDIDKHRAELAKERALSRLEARQDNLDLRRAELALSKAIARLKVAEMK